MAQTGTQWIEMCVCVGGGGGGQNTPSALEILILILLGRTPVTCLTDFPDLILGK